MGIEDRSHRNHALNPRTHPIGRESYNNPSTAKVWENKSFKALLSNSECQLIQDIPRLLGEGNYANLGHRNGGSAILLASGLKENGVSGLVYSIDIKFAKGTNALMDKFKVRHQIEKCAGSTDEWSIKLSDKIFNFVFIDADHSYKAVVSDFINWSRLIKVEGWVSFHDTNQDFSHKAIENTVIRHGDWRERTDLHIHRIRTFERTKRS